MMEQEQIELEKGKRGSSIKTTLLSIRSKMAHFFGILVLVYTVYLAKPGFALFPWHPTLMALSFAVLMLEAILMFSPFSSLIPNATRAEKAKYHWIFQIASLVTSILGLIAIYEHKERNKANPVHFKSWHSLFGITAIILSGVNVLGGIGLLYPKSTILNPSGLKLGVRKKFHALFGSLVFVVACGALILSLYTNWFNKVGSEFVWYVMLALVTVIASVVTNQVANEFIYNRNK